jgi:hypothetical protein
MEEATKRMRMAADSARAAGVEWMTALQDQADFAAGSAGGRLPPQEGVEATEEAAGGEAQATVGHAPWESTEEKAQDIEDMGRILEDYKSGSEVEEAAEVAAAVCSLAV